MPARNYDKILCAAALVALIGTGTWVGLQSSQVKAIERRAASVALASDGYTGVGIDAPEVVTNRWPDPASRAQQREWIYDVFTPPVIYYNSHTGEFSVTPPVLAKPEVETVVAEKLFGVELVEVKLNPFRLQLVGYVGGPGSYRGMFQNADTQETVLARAGQRFADLGLTVRSFDVTRRRIEIPDSMPTSELVATAIVVDERSGETTTLSTLERRSVGTPSVILRLSSTGEEREDKTGAVFMHDGATYRVGSITIAPPSVEITKDADESSGPEVQTLVPAAASRSQAPPDAVLAETPDPVPPIF